MVTTSDCTKCKRQIKISGPDPAPEIFEDFPILVYCPSCGWPNVATWRKQTPYSVSIGEKSS